MLHNETSKIRLKTDSKNWQLAVGKQLKLNKNEKMCFKNRIKLNKSLKLSEKKWSRNGWLRASNL